MSSDPTDDPTAAAAAHADGYDPALEAFERAMLGRPASMGRREVSREAELASDGGETDKDEPDVDDPRDIAASEPRMDPTAGS